MRGDHNVIAEQTIVYGMRYPSPRERNRSYAANSRRRSSEHGQRKQSGGHVTELDGVNNDRIVEAGSSRGTKRFTHRRRCYLGKG